MVIPSILDLPKDIYKLLEGGLRQDENLGSVIEKFGLDSSGVLKKYLSTKGYHPTLRMSNIGKPFRQLWYELNKPEVGEPLRGETLLKFMYGSLIEELIFSLAKSAGHEISRQQEEVSVDGIVGHIDGFISGELVDVKSCSSYSYNKFLSGSVISDDPFGYVAQLAGYARSLDLDRAYFVAVDKVSGGICVLELTKEIIIGYDVRDRIETVRKKISSPVEPERCHPDVDDGASGNKRLGINCSYCAFKFHCWRESNNGTGLRIFAYSQGPRFLTEVVREPNVYEIKHNKEDNS